MPKAFRRFYMMAAVLLSITALAKFATFFANTPILFVSDPIFRFTFKNLLAVTGLFEAIGVYLCLCSKNDFLKSSYLAWLATSFLLYRIGLWAMDYKHPCPCLGFITKSIGIPNEVANITSLLILNVLLVGSYSVLIYLFQPWRQHGKLE